MPAGHKADAEKLRRLRQAKGWTVDDLKTQSGVSTRTISRIENGGAATLVTLKVLADALSVEVEELLPQTDPADFTEKDIVEISITVKTTNTELTISHVRKVLMEMAAKLEAHGVEGGVEPLKTRGGSIVIDMLVTRQQAGAIVTLFNSGEFADIGVVAVSPHPMMEYKSRALHLYPTGAQDMATIQVMFDHNLIDWAGISFAAVDFGRWEGIFSSFDLNFIIRWDGQVKKIGKRLIYINANDNIGEAFAQFKLNFTKKNQ